MIPKKNRIKEKQVKRVLQKGKPFFSYGIVLNYLENKENQNRFSIIIGTKSVINNVTRNYFRRKFYNFTMKFLGLNSDEKNKNYDFVFTVKKKNKLDKKDKNIIFSFEKDLNFLFYGALKKIFN